MTLALSDAPVDVALQFKINWRLFDSCLSHKPLTLLVKDLQFTDDAAPIADSEAGLQKIIDRLTNTAYQKPRSCANLLLTALL